MFSRLAKVALALSALSVCSGATSTFVLETGEIIRGEVQTKTAEVVEVKTAYGDIKIPYMAIKSETLDEIPASAASSDSQMPEGATLAADEEDDGQPPTDTALAMFPDAGSTNDAKESLEARIISWQKQYRTFLQTWVPEGWSFKLRGGFTLEQTTVTKNIISLGASAKRQWDEASFSFDSFYNYETQKSAAGVETTTTDKYGASTDIKWNFLGSESHWFVSDLMSYRHDGIKKIYAQVDHGVGLGYSFTLPEWGIQWDVSMGPAVRYIDAHNYDTHWVPMAILNEQLKWDITDILRFEHKGYMGMGLTTGNEGTIYIMVGLVFWPKEIVSLALRYTNDYDSINEPSAIKNEQKLILSLEIPISR